MPAGFTKVLQTRVFESVRTLKQVNPEATEVCDNELDDDCDGEIDEGYTRCSIELLKEALSVPLLLFYISPAYLHSPTIFLDLR